MSIENPGRGPSPESRKELAESEKEALISGATDFGELFSALEKIGTIQGSQETFDAKGLKMKIARVSSGAIDLSYITRTYGLRDAVERLLKPKAQTEAAPLQQTAETPIATPEASTPENAPQETQQPENIPDVATLETNGETTPPSTFEQEVVSTPELIQTPEEEPAIEFTPEQIEEAREEMEEDLLERRKIEIIAQAADETSQGRMKEMVGAMRKQLGGRAESISVWESIRGQFKRKATDGLMELLRTVRPETKPGSLLGKVYEAINRDYDTSGGGAVDNNIPGTIVREYIRERGAELSGDELGEVEDALHLVSLIAQDKFFSFLSANQLKEIIAAQEELMKVNEEFDPARSGFFELRHVIENSQAAIQLDFATKPNFPYARPEFSARRADTLNMLSAMHQIEARKFLQYNDIDIGEDE